ncbi:MAG: hypothetical protein ACI89L_002576 [Phycisphaerales bacterium]|jgi:hypothetical protein
MTRTANNRSFARHALTIASVAAVAGLAAPANAQHFQRLDGTQSNERSYDIEQTRDAGTVTVGSVESVNADGTVSEDIYVIKHFKDGTIEWRTRFGGQGRDRGTSVQQTADGGYIVAGHTESAGGGLGLALLRLDPLGNWVWAHAYEAGSFESLVNPVEADYYLQPAVREDPTTGDFVVVTNTRDAAGGQHPVFVRTDPGGFPLINLSYFDPANPNSTAGFTDLKVLHDGTIGITGFWGVADPINDTPFLIDIDILALRADPSGFPIWVSHYDEWDPNQQRTDEAGHGIDVSDQNDFFTIGAITTRQSFVGGPPATIGTDHLMLDPFTGGVLATHYTNEMTPAYAATLITKDRSTVTSGIDLSGLGLAAGVGPGSAVHLKPGLAGIANYNIYGPSSNLREKLEGITITNLTCGFAMTGPKTDFIGLGLGGSDQLLVKVTDAWDSGCYQVRTEPFERQMEIVQIQTELVPQQRDMWEKWGQQIQWGTNENVLCFSDRCLPCPADINGDGVVDNGDIGAFVAAFLGGTPLADFNGDGVIDNGDISAFVAAFLAGC